MAYKLIPKSTYDEGARFLYGKKYNKLTQKEKRSVRLLELDL